MVPSTFSSVFWRAAPKVRGRIWKCRPKPKFTGPGDNWSRVRDQRLQGQTARYSVLMAWRSGRPDRGPASAGPRRRSGENRRFVGVFDLQVFVEILVGVLVDVVVVLVIVL